jgi:hypothetical protein
MDTSERAVRQAIAEAEDYGLSYHRDRYLKMHFQPYAYHRYPDDFQRKEKLAASTLARKRGAETRRSSVTRQKALDGTGKRNKIPLVHTGLLATKVLRGGVKYSGRWDKRSITYSPPFYAYQSPVGQLDKVKALHAMLPTEEEDIVAHVQERLLKILNDTETKKRG